jgi:imidazolonepropionase-like amidohydrolase
MRIFCLLLFISFTQLQATAQLQPIALANVTIIDVAKGKAIPNQVIVLQNGKITSISPFTGKFPSGLTIYHLNGQHVMPGMIDAHIHLFQSGGLYTRPDAMNLVKYQSYEKEIQWLKNNAGDLLTRYLRCGVTTVYDVGGPLYNYTLRDSLNDNNQLPSIFLTGPLISTYQPAAFSKLSDAPIIKVNNADEARKQVQLQLPYKPDFIKIWYIVLPGQKATDHLPIVQATIDEAHKNNLKVAVHATELETARQAVLAGADILVHSVEDTIVDDDFVKLLKKKNILYIPTLIVESKYNEVFGQNNQLSYEDYTRGNPTAIGSLFDLAHLPEEKLIARYKNSVQNNKARAAHTDSVRLVNLKKMTDAGVTVITGTDAGNIGTQHGSSYFQEMAAMQKAGLSNAQVLKFCTLNGAQLPGNSNSGSIEVGKRADLLLLGGNPLTDLQQVKNIRLVIKNGNVMQPDSLQKNTPEALVQRQLNAYNGHDIDAFLEPYSDSVEIYMFPEKLIGKGKEGMRADYGGFFKQAPQLHCKLVNRMVQGNTVIDQEYVTGVPGVTAIEAIAIYKIENDKIAKVYFIYK